MLFVVVDGCLLYVVLRCLVLLFVIGCLSDGLFVVCCSLVLASNVLLVCCLLFVV